MRPWRFITIAAGLLALVHVYIGARLLPDLPLGSAGRIAGAFILFLSWAAILTGFVARFVVASPSLAEKLAWIGMPAMGLLSSLFVLTLLRDVVLLAAALLTAIHLTEDGAAAIAGPSALAAAGAALLASLIGFVNARRGPRVTEIDVPLRDLPVALHGFTIVQFSDIHVGSTIKGHYLAAIVEKVNRLEPDLIAVTGDLVDGSVAQLAAHTASLADLKARHGAYFLTGNHEYYAGADAWVAEVRRLGLSVLMNEHVAIDHGGARMIVAGVTDYSAGGFDPAQKSDPHGALAGAPEAAARILLAHQPRSAFAAVEAGYDLQLSGHTHGGQFWPWNLFVRLQQPFTAGLNRLGDLWVYTNRGAGYWGPPKRLGVPAEIALLRLVRAVR